MTHQLRYSAILTTRTSSPRSEGVLFHLNTRKRKMPAARLCLQNLIGTSPVYLQDISFFLLPCLAND